MEGEFMKSERCDGIGFEVLGEAILWEPCLALIVKDGAFDIRSLADW